MSGAKKKEPRASWIAIDAITPDKPEIEEIIDLLDASKNEIIGAFLRLMCWADGHVSDDGDTGLSTRGLDRKIELVGFSDALCAVGWAIVSESGKVVLSNFAEKNGSSAKKRLQTAKRNARMRANQATRDENETHELSHDDHASVTGASRNEWDSDASVTHEASQVRHLEKEKEYNNYYSAGEREQLPECVERSLQPDDPPAYPKTASEVRNAIHSLDCADSVLGEVEKMATKYLQSRRAIGWQIKGSYIVNWRIDLAGYVQAWSENRRKKKALGESNHKVSSEYDDL